MRIAKSMLILLVLGIASCGSSSTCMESATPNLIEFLRNVNLEDHDSVRIEKSRGLLKEAIERCETIESIVIEGYGSFSKDQILLTISRHAQIGFDQLDKYDLDELLLYAARYGDSAAVEYLLNAGAEVNATDRFKNTPLMNSVGGAQTDGEITCLLVARGADINAQNSAGLTASLLAGEEGDTGAAKCLQFP